MSTGTNSSDTTDGIISTSADDENCQRDRYWTYFIIPCIVIFLSGILIIMGYRLFRSCYKRMGNRCRKGNSKDVENIPTVKSKKSVSFVTQEAMLEEMFSPLGENDAESLGYCSKKHKNIMTFIKLSCERLISAQTLAGVIMVSMSCVFTITSLVVYIIDATNFTTMENQIDLQSRPSDIVDLVCNIFFLIHFILRFIAANDKLRFWIQLNSLVDMFTIPPMFVNIYLGRQWLGLRFLCAFRLLNFPDVLQFLRALKNATQIRLMELTSLFICIWITSSGFVHLVENTGDPFTCYDNERQITYWNSMYLIIITMSTVGYGDAYCQTVIGKTFIILFIFGAVALFASFVPEIAEIINSSRQKYLVEYKKEVGIRHIIVGGQISLNTVQNFARNITGDDRTKHNLKGIFFDSVEPSLEIVAVFKQCYTRLAFVKGSMMNASDLKRVRLIDAEAVLILSDQSTNTPDSDDTDNIMKAIAVKNFRPDVRVILQLIKVENKTICSNLPFWSENDSVICSNEMKMGFMAAGCLAPGFSTFLTNLLFMLSDDSASGLLPWQADYIRGAEMKVYTEKFSSFFYGRSLPEVVEFCYVRLSLLLVAVSGASDRNNNIQNGLILNPGPEHFVCSQSIGFFLCLSQDDSQSVKHYCLKCHCDISAEFIKACSCVSAYIYKSLLTAEMCGMGESRGRSLRSGMSTVDLEETVLADDANSWGNIRPKEETDIDEPLGQFDAAGYFYWCPSKTFEESLLDPNTTLSNHIILCFSDSSQGSLRSFVLPLRANCLNYSRLRTIVVVGEDEAKLREEWPSVAHFPKFFFKIGSPLKRSLLRSIQVEASHMCVILSSSSYQTTEPLSSNSNDNRALLATLNIKNMALSSSSSVTTNKAMKLLYQKSFERQCSAMSAITRSGSNSCIPILTELINDENVHLLSPNGKDARMPLLLNQPFACGKTFAPSVIDALTTTVFFSPVTYKLLRMFVTWTDSEEHDHLMAEGILDEECDMTPEQLKSIANRCVINLLPLRKGILEPYKEGNFEQMFISVLRRYHVLCIGIYRFMSFYDGKYNNDDRFVITNPPSDFDLDESDLIYCLCPPDILSRES